MPSGQVSSPTTSDHADDHVSHSASRPLLPSSGSHDTVEPSAKSVPHHHVQHRVHASHKLGKQVVTPRSLGAPRTPSVGKNLNKLSTQDGAGPSASSASHSHTQKRSGSGSFTSPTLPSPRPTNTFKRNASGVVMPRTAAHGALKRNQSSGQLPRHGSSKNVSKSTAGPSTKAAAHPMKRTRSGGASRKSPVEPLHDQTSHHTVRFNLENDVVPADDNDDNAWTEDSTSLSPNTTRDHTRQNSVTADSNMAMATTAAPRPVQSTETNNHVQVQSSDTKKLDASGSIKRTSSTHSIPTADAITSRLLMRSPSAHSAAVSMISAAAAGATATPYTNDTPSQASTLNESPSSGSVGRDLISRFINGSNSQDPPEVRARAILNAHADDDDDQDSNAIPIDSHRRNKSTTNLSTAYSRSHPHPKALLPPSRTQQKLELQRVSTALESTKQVIPVLARPSAPQILSSGVHSFGYGFGIADNDFVPAQIQSLYTQIGKEYGVVRRFRQPVEAALSRVQRKRTTSAKAKGKQSLPASRSSDGRNAAQQDDLDSLQFRTMPFRTPTRQRDEEAVRVGSPEDSRMGSSGKRKSRVSFDIPPRGITTSEGIADRDHRERDARVENDEQRQEERLDGSPTDEVLELCRRMWDLGDVVHE